MRLGIPACLMELMPRSERARLIDLVKFKGVVEGSRRSGIGLRVSPVIKRVYAILV